MGLFSRSEDEFTAVQVDEPINQPVADAPGELLRIRPNKDNGGPEATAKVWERLHTPSADPIAFEIHYDGERVKFYTQTSTSRVESLETRLQSTFTESWIQHPAPSDSAFPSVKAGEYVAASTLETEQPYFYPLRSWNDLPDDPYSDIIEEMVTGDSRAVIQFVARDEADEWTKGKSGGLLRSAKPGIMDEVETLREQPVEGWLDPQPVDPPESDLQKAKILEGELGKPGFSLTLRVIVISPTEEEAQTRCEGLTSLVSRTYKHRQTEQALVGSPVPSDQVHDFVDACRERTWNKTGTILTADELAGLAHLPEGDCISNPAMDWSRGNLGEGIPPSHPRFDWDSVDLPAAASRKAKQLAMLEASGRGDPFYIGWGTKHGVETGIYEDFTDKHMQGTGATGMGKSTVASIIGSQIMSRGYGALIVVLGKDDDDEDFIREWPEDRPREDFVFIDTGSEFDHKVRFNLLEVPDELEPGTTDHRSYVESLCDDFCAAFAQAGGDDSLYPLMRGVTRTLVRGMAMSNRTCTPLDLAEAASRHENMEEFANWMEDEGVHFIDETARRFADDKEASDFEPIARRMEELRHNGNIREWLAAREPTVRIQNLVDEGKVCVLRIDESLGETERAFAINPIVRRFGHAKKMASKRGNDDPFFILWDEADKAITKHSSVAQMLSEYRAYGAHFFLLYQSPSYQLPKYLKDATEAQISTTISFSSTGSDAQFVQRQHSADVDAASLRDLPEHSCYLNTGAKGREETPSVRVDTFPPICEVREELGVSGGLDDDEVAELKRESTERYGEKPPSTETVKAQSQFSGVDPDGESPPDELDMEDTHCRNQALKAIYDESIRNGDPGGFVAVETVLDRLQTYLPGGESITDTGKAWREVFQQIPDAYLAHRTNDADVREVRALDTGFMNVGTSENDGADEHWEQMADAYVPMTQLGFVYEIPAQTGEQMPDALARLDDVLDLDGVTDPGEIAERVNSYREEYRLLDRLAGTKDLYIESEHSTGATQPSQTIRNLVQAANEGHRCMFIAREKVGERVHNTLENAPFCCRSSHSVDGERRFYTATSSLVIEGESMTRPGAAENVWVYDEAADEYVLRDTNGTVHARFSTPAEIFEDAGKYPAGGERTIKPPVIPEHEFDDPGDVAYDIVVVPEPDRNATGEKQPLTPYDLELYQDDGENIPLPYLVDSVESAASEEQNKEPAATIDEAVTQFRNGST